MKRGEIYYITKNDPVTGQELFQGRPAVIVSNNLINEKSRVVEVVYLTTKEKPPMPTHVTIRSAPQISTALCEQVCSAGIERITNFCGKCTDTEMQAIDRALLISFGMDSLCDNGGVRAPEIISEPDVIVERNLYKRLYEQLLEKITR